MAILHDRAGTFSVISSRCVTRAAMFGLALGGTRRVAAAHAGPRASCERWSGGARAPPDGGWGADERPRPVDPVRRRPVRGGGGPPPELGASLRAAPGGLRRASSASSRRCPPTCCGSRTARCPGRTVYALATFAAPLLWVGAIALSGGYEARVLGLGSEEFQRIFRAFVGLTATIGFVSYALEGRHRPRLHRLGAAAGDGAVVLRVTTGSASGSTVAGPAAATPTG